MAASTDIAKLKELYASLDRHKDAGEDVVADIRQEINNLELQYLKEDVFPELMRLLATRTLGLRCTIDMSLQFDGEHTFDYSYCKSGSSLFIREKFECGEDVNIGSQAESRTEEKIEIEEISTAKHADSLHSTTSMAPAPQRTIRIVVYSDKAIAVYGETRQYAEQFKEIGGYFNARLREGAGWIFSKKRELEVRNVLWKEKIEGCMQETIPTAAATSHVKSEHGQSKASSLKNIKCTLEGFRTFLSSIKNNHGRSYSQSSISVYCTATRSNYMRSKVRLYHNSGYLYNLTDLQSLSQLYDDVQADFEAKKTNSSNPQTVRLFIQFIETYFSEKKETDVEPAIIEEKKQSIESPKKTEEQTRGHGIVINSISFDDYKISSGNSTEKFIKFINLIGPELVYQMKIPFCGGYLVDRVINQKYFSRCKSVSGGYWLNTNCNTSSKIELMKRIGDYFGIEVTFDVEEKEFNEPATTQSVLTTNISSIEGVSHRAKYSLNGQEPQNKRRTVFAVVKMYMKLHPRATWSEVLGSFPKELQGSYGVVATFDSIKYRIRKGFDDAKRYFLDPSRRFRTIDGIEFAVCHQWGNQFDNFCEYVEDKFGWTIEEVMR